jgi:hypothetical protein
MSAVFLPDLPARLRALTGCTAGPTYALLYRWAVAGRLPVTRSHRSFFIDSKDLPAIAKALGLKRGEPYVAPKKARTPRAVAPKKERVAPKQERAPREPLIPARAWKNFVTVHGRAPASLDEFNTWHAEWTRITEPYRAANAA